MPFGLGTCAQEAGEDTNLWKRLKENIEALSFNSFISELAHRLPGCLWLCCCHGHRLLAAGWQVLILWS